MRFAVHVVWLLAAVVGAAAWGQHVASSKEREFRERLAALAARPKTPGVRPVDFPVAAVEPEAPPPPAAGADPEPPAERKADEEEKGLTPAQIRALLAGKDRRALERAVRAIERVADPSTRLALLREALGVAEPRVRERALDLLRKIGGPEAADLVAQALRGDSDENVRRRAARHLGELGGPAALAALHEAARAEPIALQVAAAGSLNRLGDPAPMHVVIHRLGGMLDDPDGAVREAAVDYLQGFRTPAAIPHLGRALRDPDSDIRREAVDGLEDIEAPEVLPLLEQAVRDPHPRVAAEARQALESFRSRK